MLYKITNISIYDIFRQIPSKIKGPIGHAHKRNRIGSMYFIKFDILQKRNDTSSNVCKETKEKRLI